MSYMFTKRDLLKLGAASLATGVMTESAWSYSAPKNLVVAVPQSPSALEPVLRNNTSTVQTIYSVFDRLLAIDFNTGAVRSGLAESWTQVDATTYDFKLRQGVKFHDGSDLSADDVVFSFSKERTQGPKQGASVAGQYQGTIERVEALDASTVRLVTKTVDPAILLKVGGWSTEIVSKSAFAAAGGWENWGKKPIGTGPYKIVENRQDEVLILEAHKDYWGGAPAFGRIEFRIVPEAAVRVNGLLAGDFHIATALNPDQLDQINSAGPFEVVGGAIQAIRTLNFSAAGGVLKNAALRRAVSHAIDRDAIVQSIWQGRTEVPNGFQDKAYGEIYFSESRLPVYDPELARKLIAEAGYKDEEIVYRSQSAAYPLELQTSQVIVEMLREVGLNVRLEVKENWDQVYQKPLESVIWNESTLMAWPDPTGGLIRQYGPAGAFQREPFSWHNEAFNKAVAEFETSSDPARRKQLHGVMLDIVQVDDPPCMALFKNALFYGKRKDIPWLPYPTLYADYGPGNASTRL